MYISKYDIYIYIRGDPIDLDLNDGGRSMGGSSNNASGRRTDKLRDQYNILLTRSREITVSKTNEDGKRYLIISSIKHKRLRAV